MAVSLLEAAKHNQYDDFRTGVIQTIGYEGSVMGILPFMNISGGSYTYLQEEDLGGVSYRGFNEGWEEDTGLLSEKSDTLHSFGGNIDIDKDIVKMNGEAVRGTREDMKLKAMAQGFNRYFIKGDTDSNPREMNGLQKRIVGTQLVNAGSTAGGDALSLTKLDEAIDAVDGPTHIAMNKTMRRRLTAASRNTSVGGFITYSQDEFGRKVEMYGDLPIILIDEDENGEQVLPFDEASGNGGAAQCTSIYILSLGDGSLVGIQNGDIEARDMGLLDDAATYRTNVSHLHGIALMRPKCVARLRGITNAPVVA